MRNSINATYLAKIKSKFATGELLVWVWNGILVRLERRFHTLRALRYLWQRRQRLTQTEFPSFSWFDKWLWASGQTWSLPAMDVLREEDDNIVLRIGSLEFYWPKSFSIEGLTWLYLEVFSPGWKNPHAYQTLFFRIKPKDWVLDVGASEGFFSIAAASRGARVVAFEALPEVVKAMQSTVQSLKLSSQIAVWNFACGEHDGKLMFRVNRDAPACSRSTKSGEGIIIPGRSIDSLWRQGLFPRVDFLKIDVEGDEQAVLSGAKELIQSCRPRLAIAVYHTGTQASEVHKLVLSICPDYEVVYRGLHIDTESNEPRRKMIFAR